MWQKGNLRNNFVIKGIKGWNAEKKTDRIHYVEGAPTLWSKEDFLSVFFLNS